MKDGAAVGAPGFFFLLFSTTPGGSGNSGDFSSAVKKTGKN